MSERPSPTDTQTDGLTEGRAHRRTVNRTIGQPMIIADTEVDNKTKYYADSEV